MMFKLFLKNIWSVIIDPSHVTPGISWYLFCISDPVEIKQNSKAKLNFFCFKFFMVLFLMAPYFHIVYISFSCSHWDPEHYGS